MNLGQYLFLFVFLIIVSVCAFSVMFNIAEPSGGYSTKRKQRIDIIIWLLSFGVALSWTLLS